MKKVIGILIIIGVLVGGWYFISQKGEGLRETPQYEKPQEIKEIELNILEPKDGLVTNSESIVVRGVTTPFADVFINDVELQADAQGNFQTSITLDEGENIIAIAANNEEGKVAEKEITVTLELPE